MCVLVNVFEWTLSSRRVIGDADVAFLLFFALSQKVTFVSLLCYVYRVRHFNSHLFPASARNGNERNSPATVVGTAL
jgi:hypothetical protein